MKHVMLDLETLGKSAGCAIRSVGAAAFELDGSVGGTFYMNVSGMSCWIAGLAADAGTVDFWSKQSKEARDKLTEDQRPIEQAVDEFHTWFRSTGAAHVWSQGAGFDVPIWEAAVRAVSLARRGKPLSVPWRYWDVRCTRTIYAVSGFDPRGLKREGTHHCALDDALHQIRCVQAAWVKLQAKGGVDDGDAVLSGGSEPGGGAPGGGDDPTRSGDRADAVSRRPVGGAGRSEAVVGGAA